MVVQGVEPHCKVFLTTLCQMGEVFLASVVGIPVRLSFVGSDPFPGVAGGAGDGEGHFLLPAVAPYVYCSEFRYAPRKQDLIKKIYVGS